MPVVDMPVVGMTATGAAILNVVYEWSAETLETAGASLYLVEVVSDDEFDRASFEKTTNDKVADATASTTTLASAAVPRIPPPLLCSFDAGMLLAEKMAATTVPVVGSVHYCGLCHFRR
jgi:hypothetical protein